MRDRPTGIPDSAVLDAVRRHWRGDADEAAHLPVGFGAHHWRVASAGAPLLFVTFDRPGAHHTPESLERAYASAAALAAFGLDFVAASLPTNAGRYTVPLADGLLSAVPWITGTSPHEFARDDDLLRRTGRVLERLHAAPPPEGTPVWRPVVGADLPARLADLLGRGWDSGPLGEPARQALLASTERIERWSARYRRLVDEAGTRPWVVTHGEPHPQNLLLTASGPVLVDWESVALAPRERDLRALVERGSQRPPGVDDEMLEMFDLEWRLDEVSQYSIWFSSPHVGGADDAIAFDGLGHELNRPEWTPLGRVTEHSARAQARRNEQS